MQKSFKKTTKELLSQLLGKDGSILILDPSEPSRSLIKSFFLRLEVTEFRTCSSTAEAKRLMLTNRFNLIVCEWLMDDQNGIQFCREIRKIKQHQTTPFILLSSENMKSDVVLASEVNIDRYIIKPFSYNVFVSKIHAICKQSLQPTQYQLSVRDGNLAFLQERYDDAESYFSKAMEIEPRAAKPLLGKAKIQFALGNLNACRMLIKNTLHLNPNYIEAHRILLSIYQEIGNTDGVLKEATYLNKLSPDNPHYLMILAEKSLSDGNFAKGEQLFKRVLLNSPRIAKAHKGLGDISFARQDYEKAEKYYKKAIDIAPNDLSALNQLALTFAKKGLHQSALSVYMAGLEIDPDNPKILFNMGMAYEELNRLDLALECYENACFQDPGYKKASKAVSRLKKIS